MDTNQIIKNRYACREYKPEQISDDDLKLLIDAANAAPAAMGDYSGLELLIIQDENLRKEIDAACANAMPMMSDHPTYEAPTLMFICAKPNPQFEMLPYCGGSCIAENIMIQATSLGLGSVYIMAVPTVMQEKQELLEKIEIKEGYLPIILVSVGYAKSTEIPEKPKRLETRIL